jgi:hypothetical protein
MELSGRRDTQIFPHPFLRMRRVTICSGRTFSFVASRVESFSLDVVDLRSTEFHQTDFDVTKARAFG